MAFDVEMAFYKKRGRLAFVLFVEVVAIGLSALLVVKARTFYSVDPIKAVAVGVIGVVSGLIVASRTLRDLVVRGVAVEITKHELIDYTQGNFQRKASASISWSGINEMSQRTTREGAVLTLKSRWEDTFEVLLWLLAPADASRLLDEVHRRLVGPQAFPDVESQAAAIESLMRKVILVGGIGTEKVAVGVDDEPCGGGVRRRIAMTVPIATSMEALATLDSLKAHGIPTFNDDGDWPVIGTPVGDIGFDTSRMSGFVLRAVTNCYEASPAR